MTTATLDPTAPTDFDAADLPGVDPEAEPADPTLADPATHTGSAGLSVTAADLNLAVHDGVLTLVSPKTGDHRTFKVETVRGGALDGKRIVSLLIAPEVYEPFGFVQTGDSRTAKAGTVNVWYKKRGFDGAKSQHERFADLLSRPEYWAARGVQFLMALSCRRCGKLLTNVDSLKTGYGPYCRKKMGL
jgi:hypothetical protein